MSLARPVVTFDIDGVLCRPPFGINPGKGRHKSREKRAGWNLLWLTERWRYRFRKPMPGAVEGLSRVAEFADIRVVSARGMAARRYTERWFERHFGFVPELHMRPSWRESSAQFKARRVPQLAAAAHVEDDPFTAQWVAELVPDVFLVDWPRNRWLEGEQIHRIDNVSDGVEKIRDAVALDASPAPRSVRGGSATAT